jgi:toxin ParE1/3/4
MESYKVTFLQSALDDLEGIVLYIAADSKENALIWHDKLVATAKKLSIFPLMGVLVPDRKISRMGFRMLPVGNYLIFYKVYEQDKEITILRVIHGSRDYPALFTDYVSEKDK